MKSKWSRAASAAALTGMLLATLALTGCSTLLDTASQLLQQGDKGSSVDEIAEEPATEPPMSEADLDLLAQLTADAPPKIYCG